MHGLVGPRNTVGLRMPRLVTTVRVRLANADVPVHFDLTILFNANDVSNWTTRDGKPAGWKVSDGILHVVPGTGDIMSEATFTDFLLHLEFRCPDMPDATGQAKGNSGVFLKGRYEVQVLDSYGWEKPGLGDCGGIDFVLWFSVITHGG